MRIRKVMAVAIAGLVAGAAPAAAQSGNDRAWSVSFEAGAERGIKGSAVPFGVGNLDGAPVGVRATGFGTVYGTGTHVSVGVGRRMGEMAEVRGRFVWSRHEGKNSEVGTRRRVTPVPATEVPLFALLTEETAVGADVGYRRYLSSGKTQPFIGGQVGFVQVDAIQVDFTAPALAFTLSDVKLSGKSTVPTAGISFGLLRNLSDALGVYVGADLQWRGSLKAGELEALGLKGGPQTGGTAAPVPPVALDQTSRGWSLPVSGGIHLRF